MMDLQAMARDLSLKLEAAGFPKSEAATRQVFNLAEEVGEFVGAYRRWKGMARRKGTFEAMARELADVVITAYVTAEELGIELDREISSKLEVIYSRGWHETAESDQGAALTNDDIDHGVRVMVLPGVYYNDAGMPVPGISRNHGIGRITWYSKNGDPTKTMFGVAMDDGHGTSTAKLVDAVLLPGGAS